MSRQQQFTGNKNMNVVSHMNEPTC